MDEAARAADLRRQLAPAPESPRLDRPESPRIDRDTSAASVARSRSFPTRSFFGSMTPDDVKVSYFYLLGQHFVTFSAEITAVVVFWLSGNYLPFAIALTILLFSGIFCSYVAWSCRRPAVCSFGCLPLKNANRAVRCVCFLPVSIVCGLLQGILVPLTLSERPGRKLGGQGISDDASRLHCKAVVGIFENILIGCIVFQTYIGSHVEEESVLAVTFMGPFEDWQMRYMLRGILFIVVMSAGISVVELDYCVCTSLERWISLKHFSTSDTTQNNYFVHVLYRFSEIMCRQALHITFLTLMSKEHKLVCAIPLLVSILWGVAVVYWYGGSEVNSMVRILCAVPCVFVNIFRFIDSPYKRTAALQISKSFFWRGIIEVVMLPCIAIYFYGVEKTCHAIFLLYKYNPASVWFVAFCFLFFCIVRYSPIFDFNLKECKSIFECCRNCDTESVAELCEAAIQLDLNSMDVEGDTPLILALCSGRRDDQIAQVCEELVNAGARVDQRPGEDRLWFRRQWIERKKMCWTPLHLAAAERDRCVMEALMPGIPRPSQDDGAWYHDNRGDTPLHVACRYGKEDMVKILVAKRPDWLALQNHEGRTPEDIVGRSKRLTRALGDTLHAAGGEQPDESEENQSQRAAWEERRLTVGRTRVEVAAPGLCSFVAASAGGPFCSVFLAPIPEDDEVEISEPERPQSLERDQSTLSRTASTSNSPSVSTDQNLQVTDLEPVHAKRETPFPAWRTNFDKSRSYTNEFLLTHAAPCQLGKGSHGLIWKAKSRKSGICYAIKNMKGKDGIAWRECEMADLIRTKPHPCIVGLFLVHQFEALSLSLLCMEFCPHNDLEQQIVNVHKKRQPVYMPPNRSGRTELTDADFWLVQVFLGLEHIHKRAKLLVRDLKPGNVVMGRGMRAKLTDFGFGKLGIESSGAWSFQCPPGTPGYASPEVLHRKKHNAKADLYSFGVLTWITLSGGFCLVTREKDRLRCEACASPGALVSELYHRVNEESPKSFWAYVQEDFRMINDYIRSPKKNRLIGELLSVPGAYPLPSQTGVGLPRQSGGDSPDDECLHATGVLSASVKELILKLVSPRADNRPGHEDIRSSSYFHMFKPPIPSADDSRSEVEKWLEATGFPAHDA